MSIFDHPDEVPPVATWRCPHCATLQPESTRCWACERSPMTCSTCRYYRRSVIGPVGFCGLDRKRELLAGDEVKPCWQAPTDVLDLVSDRPGSGRTSWVTLAERQAAAPRPAAVPPPAPRWAGVPTPGPSRPVGRRDIDIRPIPVAAANGLVEAPIVPPGRKIVSEAQRRARVRRDRQRSLDGEPLG